jgi:bifunctional ADP-heptose synthase (sugar kinase/adenylyltransferase)
VVGEDELSGLVRTDLADAGVQVNAVVDRARPTTMKQRFWADGYKLLQVDELDNSPLNEIHIDEIRNHISDSEIDVVVFSDFRHGLFHAESISKLSAAIPDGVLKAADSQVSNRWGNILDFQGFDLITPNEGEGRFALGDQDSGVRSLALRLLEEGNARNMIMTLGERGVLAYRRSSTAPRSFFYLDSFANTLVDAVGAGDALLSAATLALKSSGSLVEAAIIGEAAAAVACEIDGNVPVERDDIKRRLDNLLNPTAPGSN